MLQLPSGSMKSENLPLSFLELKHPKRVKMKMVIIEQTKGFSVSVMTVSKHRKRTENKSRFSLTFSQPLIIFSSGKLKKVDRIFHTY